MAVAWRHAELAQGSFLFYHAPNRPLASINRCVVLSCHTHHTRAILPLHLYFFTIFSVRSLAKLVIGNQEHIEDIWYDQYNVLHFDSCHVLHLVLVLILSMLL